MVICLDVYPASTFSTNLSTTRLVLITNRRLGFLFSLLIFITRVIVIPNPVAFPLAATIVYDCVDKGDAENISSCIRRERISS